MYQFGLPHQSPWIYRKMPTIKYIGKGFDKKRFPQANGSHQVSISPVQLYWGLLTIGISHWWELTGVRPFLNSSGIMLSAIATLSTKNGIWIPAQHYNNLTPDEKRINTYRLGLGFAKVIAMKKLNVGPVVDTAVFERTHRVKHRGRRRSDLIGSSSNGKWFVIEVKARRNTSDIDWVEVKKQAKSISTIDGESPAASAGIATLIFPNQISVEARDPKGDGRKLEFP